VGDHLAVTVADEDLAATLQHLEEIATLLPRVWDVLEASRSNRRLTAGPDPDFRPLCDDPEHRSEGWRVPCPACRVRADREGWVPALGQVPIHVGLVDAAVQAQLVLTDLEQRVLRSLVVCPYPPRMVTPVGRAHRLAADLLPLVEDGRLLARAARDTAAAAEALSVAVDGEPSVRLQVPCPHCRRRTLVADFDDQVIRCSGRAPCYCGQAGCVCTEGGRHEWSYRHGKGGHGEWGVLAKLLEVVFGAEAS
jgi:hypothetical protein